MKKVTNPQDIPSGHHYAILVFEAQSLYIPGDERSRTSPGHGYPECTETFTTIACEIYETRAEWENALSEYYKSNQKRKDIAAIEVSGKAIVDISVNVTVSSLEAIKF